MLLIALPLISLAHDQTFNRALACLLPVSLLPPAYFEAAGFGCATVRGAACCSTVVAAHYAHQQAEQILETANKALSTAHAAGTGSDGVSVVCHSSPAVHPCNPMAGGCARSDAQTIEPSRTQPGSMVLRLPPPPATRRHKRTRRRCRSVLRRARPQLSQRKHAMVGRYGTLLPVQNRTRSHTNLFQDGLRHCRPMLKRCT